MSVPAGARAIAICRVKGLKARTQAEAGRSRQTVQSRCIEFEGSRVGVDSVDERVA